MAENQNLKAGDVVRLKSGGPKMTVREPMKLTIGDMGEPIRDVVCMWFEPKEISVPLDALELVASDEEERRQDEAQRAELARAAGEANEAINAGRGRW